MAHSLLPRYCLREHEDVSRRGLIRWVAVPRPRCRARASDTRRELWACHPQGRFWGRRLRAHATSSFSRPSQKDDRVRTRKVRPRVAETLPVRSSRRHRLEADGRKEDGATAVRADKRLCAGPGSVRTTAGVRVLAAIWLPSDRRGAAAHMPSTLSGRVLRPRGFRGHQRPSADARGPWGAERRRIVWSNLLNGGCGVQKPAVGRSEHRSRRSRKLLS